MTLISGARLGPYEIQSGIGAGGMGEVYKAKDTRLDRSVAIKVLRPEFSADADRRARFEREAKTVAGLNHPHICTLHDVGESDGTTYLVMELLAGETLAGRLEKGPLPLEQALTVATEIADALAAAHRQGVTHRDLKPGNVMLTRAGAKLLDFGLAKLAGHGDRSAAESFASVPTATRPLTSEGAIVGTLQYMAPEQVEGKSADARTDIWALGAILYEMLTGHRAFQGGSAASLIGNIMNAEPASMATSQPLTPPFLDRIVRKCLSKSPDDRWDSAHDVADELRWVRETSGIATPPGTRSRRRSNLRTALLVGAVAAVAGVVGAGLMWSLRPPVTGTSLAGLSLEVRPAEEVNSGGITEFLLPAGGSRTALAWTPDGRALVFVGRRGGVQQLYVRRLDAAEATPLAGTEGAQVPVISADGKWVAFWSNRAIRRVPLVGGPIVDLLRPVTVPPWGLASDRRGTLFLGREDGRIWAISPDGASAAITAANAGETFQGLPCPLPSGQALLYTVRRQRFTSGEEEIVAQALAGGKRTVVLRNAADGRYLPTGHLVFLRQGVLFAVPFDPDRLEIRGTPTPVLNGVVAQAQIGNHAGDITNAGQFAVAATGTLAWLRAAPVSLTEKALVTVDRRGVVSPLTTPVRTFGNRVRLNPRSPEELAVNLATIEDTSLWTHLLNRPGSFMQVLRDGEASCPIWTPDGRRITFWWNKNGQRSVAWLRADGTTPPEVIATGDFQPSSWTPDGRQLAAVTYDGEAVLISMVEGGQAKVGPLSLAAKGLVYWPEFSPDGRWLAYGSDDSGRFEIYVRPFPGPGPRTQVSATGGAVPAWRADGRALFFLAARRYMTEVEFRPGSPPGIGPPSRLFDSDGMTFGALHVRPYDVTPDGQRFFVLQPQSAAPRMPVTHINLTLNWLEDVKAKVPVRR